MPRAFLSAVAVLAVLALPPVAQAELVNCTIDRGNLCFPTRCNNSAKSERLILNLEANKYSYCPSRYSDANCFEESMSFGLQESSILGVSIGTRETAARSIFLNRNTGSLTISLIAAGGIAEISFGTCELRR